MAAEFIAEHLDRRLPIVCTGHSLGGALAMICARKLQADGFKIREWVGFGAPKVQIGGRPYSFPQTNYRFRADIVPLLPNLPGYKHQCDVKRLMPDYQRKPTWVDHGIQHYVAEVN